MKRPLLEVSAEGVDGLLVAQDNAAFAPPAGMASFGK
jgi:hypothetical protein